MIFGLGPTKSYAERKARHAEHRRKIAERSGAKITALREDIASEQTKAAQAEADSQEAEQKEDSDVLAAFVRDACASLSGKIAEWPTKADRSLATAICDDLRRFDNREYDEFGTNDGRAVRVAAFCFCDALIAKNPDAVVPFAGDFDIEARHAIGMLVKMRDFPARAVDALNELEHALEVQAAQPRGAHTPEHKARYEARRSLNPAQLRELDEQQGRARHAAFVASYKTPDTKDKVEASMRDRAKSAL